MKIYLAGPDVFRPDATARAEAAHEIGRRHGFEPLLPVDHSETSPERIFEANLDLIRRAQIVVANLNPFRGPEPDPGTAFERGDALALGLRIGGDVPRRKRTVQRVERAEGRGSPPQALGGRPTDRQGFPIENFGWPCNLMRAVPCRLVESDREACLPSIRARPAP